MDGRCGVFSTSHEIPHQGSSIIMKKPNSRVPNNAIEPTCHAFCIFPDCFVMNFGSDEALSPSQSTTNIIPWTWVISDIIKCLNIKSCMNLWNTSILMLSFTNNLSKTSGWKKVQLIINYNCNHKYISKRQILVYGI